MIISWISLILFWTGFFVFFLVFAGYPGVLFIRSRLFPHLSAPPESGVPEPDLMVSVLVVFRNAKGLLDDKITNFLSLDYPEDKLELVLVSDGSDDGSEHRDPSWPVNALKWFHFDAHQGKNKCMNFGATQCSGQIIVFSDVDAMLSTDSVKRICRHFSDPRTGGVCGRRVVSETLSGITSSQVRYIGWDAMIKELEMKNGLSITAHDGKANAVRKACFAPIAQGVTDDAFIALGVIGQGSRFVFDRKVTAAIRVPSRSPLHELKRRKRIVSQSLNGLFIHRRLFNPRQYGLFSFGLFINKVLRRLLPVAGIAMLLSSFALWRLGSFFYGVLFVLPMAGMAVFASYPLISPHLTGAARWQKKLNRLLELGFFFLLGMTGTLWGTISFISGEKITKWEPVKK